MDKDSGVGVVDKSVAILDAVAGSAATLADLVARTGLPRPTAHRLAQALEVHGLVDRDEAGRFVLGPRIAAWSAGGDPLLTRAEHVVVDLRDATGVSAQVYRRAGEQRLCIAAAEPAAGLRDTVPVGALLTLKAGSAAQVLVAWLPTRERAMMLRGAAFTAGELTTVRERGWAHSLGQREPGVASVSVPVWSGDEVVAALSLSGPTSRLAKPTKAQIAALSAAATTLGA